MKAQKLLTTQDLGDRLKKHRLLQGDSVTKVAEITGASRARVSGWEETGIIKSTHLLRFIGHYNLDARQLIPTRGFDLDEEESSVIALMIATLKKDKK